MMVSGTQKPMVSGQENLKLKDAGVSYPGDVTKQKNFYGLPLLIEYLYCFQGPVYRYQKLDGLKQKSLY